MINRFVVRAALVVGVLSFVGAAFAQEKVAEQKSLYQRVGGYDVIAGVVDDFLKQIQADPAFQRFGGGRAQASLVRGRQLTIDLICHLSGGPCAYIGRDLKTAHQGLAITQAEFEAAGQKMAASLAKFKIAEADQKELMAVIGKLQGDIVEKPAAPAEPKPGTKS